MFRANCVFQGKRKLLKNPEQLKYFQYSVYSKVVRKGGGLNSPPLSLIFYKSFSPGQSGLTAFAYFLLANLST